MSIESGLIGIDVRTPTMPTWQKLSFDQTLHKECPEGYSVIHLSP